MPSLGEKPEGKLVLVRQTEALPGSRKELVACIEKLLAQGGIQKLIIQVGKPILVEKLIDPPEVTPNPLTEGMPEPVPVDEFSVIRDGEVVELLAGENWSALKVLFWAFQKASAANKKPQKLLVPSFKIFRSWLGLDTSRQLFGVFDIPVVQSKDVPDDGGLLVCGNTDEFDGECFSIRIPINIKEKTK